MFEYNIIVPDSDLSMYFNKVGNDLLAAYSKETDEKVGEIKFEGCTFTATDDAIHTQYKLWSTRPECRVGQPADIKGKNLVELAEIYDELLVGAYLLTQKVPVPSDSYKKTLEWLHSTDFYSCPASTKYHESFPGGLLVHSLDVYNKMLELMNVASFATIDVAEATICALVHDWCKIGMYSSYQKNVKNEVTGQWEKETAYTVDQKGVPLGHGTSSMYLALRCIRLTVEQSIAIRWHMGEYNVASNEINELQKANADYPMCYLLQFADRLACTNYTEVK